MAEQTTLRPELRDQMGDWVMDYVHRRKRLRRRLTVAGVSVAVGAAVIGASAWVALAPQSVVQHRVTCLDQPSLSSRSMEASLTDASAQSPASDALDLCTSLWRTGQLDPSSSPHGADGKVHSVPPLALCTRTDGTFVVLPRGASDPDSVALCDSLGLVPVPGR